MEDLTTWLGLGINLGIGGVFLWLLFKGLSSGTIRTNREFQEHERIQQLRLDEKDAYIKKIEAINDRLDARNDLLSRQIEPVLEISKAHGMLEALPPSVSERVIEP